MRDGLGKGRGAGTGVALYLSLLVWRGIAALKEGYFLFSTSQKPPRIVTLAFGFRLAHVGYVGSEHVPMAGCGFAAEALFVVGACRWQLLTRWAGWWSVRSRRRTRRGKIVGSDETTVSGNVRRTNCLDDKVSGSSCVRMSKCRRLLRLHIPILQNQHHMMDDSEVDVRSLTRTLRCDYLFMSILVFCGENDHDMIERECERERTNIERWTRDGTRHYGGR
jgi:hypothetical protein